MIRLDTTDSAPNREEREEAKETDIYTFSPMGCGEWKKTDFLGKEILDLRELSSQGQNGKHK